MRQSVIAHQSFRRSTVDHLPLGPRGPLIHKMDLYPRKVRTDFILFFNYILKVCPKFTKMNKQIKILSVNVSQFQHTVYHVTSSRTVTLAFAGSEYIMVIWIPFTVHFISKFAASISKSILYQSLVCCESFLNS